jgi:hypothetical protein
VSIGDEGYNDDGNVGEGAATLVRALSEPSGGSAPLRTDPSMSDNGEYVFFQSPVALTPGALNDVPIGSNEGTARDEGFAQNVYEWRDGHVSLISDGQDVTPTFGAINGKVSPMELLGTDATASNVFFDTYDRLAPEDTDSARDIYDAHVCSEAQPCSAPRVESASECGEGSCHGIAAAPGENAPPVSELFSGPGNLAAPPATLTAKPVLTRAQKLKKALEACRKDRQKRKRVTCERRARSRYGHIATVKKARSKRRAK